MESTVKGGISWNTIYNNQGFPTIISIYDTFISIYSVAWKKKKQLLRCLFRTKCQILLELCTFILIGPVIFKLSISVTCLNA